MRIVQKLLRKTIVWESISVSFGFEENMFLWGHIMSILGNITNVQSILRLVGYYRKYVEIFSKVVVPMFEL